MESIKAGRIVLPVQHSVWEMFTPQITGVRIHEDFGHILEPQWLIITLKSEDSGNLEACQKFVRVLDTLTEFTGWREMDMILITWQ